MVAMKRLRIFGAGMRGGLVADLLRWQFAESVEIEGYYEDRELPGGKGPFGLPVLGTVEEGIEEIVASGSEAFVAFGTAASAKACELFLKIEALDVPISSVISPAAHVFPSAHIGRNALIFPGAYIGSDVAVGDMLCAHGNAVLEHHCTVGHNVFLSPGISLANSVNVGSHCLLGTGAASIPGMTIGCGTLVGAGATVVEDIPPHSVAVGRPARVIRGLRAGDEVPTAEEIESLSKKGIGQYLVRD